MEQSGQGARDVVIVGAGVAGTSVFLCLVRALGRGNAGRMRSIRIVDPNPVGRGLAFGDTDPLLLCNSAAEVNSLLADEPADFVAYLRARGLPGEPRDCVPRVRMAEYCRDRFDTARKTAEALGVEVAHVPAAVDSITAGTVRLSTGQELRADAVVVCTGVHRPRVPDGFAAFTGHPRYSPAPYPAARLLDPETGPPPGAEVLVLGCRQSAIDASLLLCRDGHRVTMTSPSGVLPAVRVSLGAPVREFPSLERVARLDPADPLLEEKVRRAAVEAVRSLDRTPLRRQTSSATDPVARLREETALVEADACAWPGAVMAMMEAVIELGARLPAARRRALLERHGWFIARYATAMTVVNARLLLAHIDSGALRLARAYPRAVAYEAGAWRVEWPAPGEPDHFGPGRFGPGRFDHVVNATGFDQPRLYWSADGTALHPAEPPRHSGTVDFLAADLRVRRSPGAGPEPVWVVGVGTHVRIPFSNHLRNVVRQARRVAEEVSGAADGGEGAAVARGTAV
ncbi:FAD/NAD(P)-binding protein [Streptomyces sp. NPDC037389]|uniref:FAD/NAD(P)-binding protein n=1 Tax=Streptomyces sp. NPDC037389 TaxID=3155369 RepID=UPI0033C4E889